MRKSNSTSLMRTPRLRPFGAWLAIFGLVVHALAMTAHQAPYSPATPFPFDPHVMCITGGGAPGESGVPGPSGDHGSSQAGSPCPLCQRLGAFDSYLPVLLAIRIASSEQPTPLAAGQSPVQLPRLALTSLNPRGPPSLA